MFDIRYPQHYCKNQPIHHLTILNAFSGFQAGAGILTFSDGQLYNYITIQIVDNALPEDEKTFYVNLFNPTNGAAWGWGHRYWW